MGKGILFEHSQPVTKTSNRSHVKRTNSRAPRKTVPFRSPKSSLISGAEVISRELRKDKGFAQEMIFRRFKLGDSAENSLRYVAVRMGVWHFAKMVSSPVQKIDSFCSGESTPGVKELNKYLNAFDFEYKKQE